MKKRAYAIKYFNPATGLTYTMGKDFKFYLATAEPLTHYDYNTARTLAYTNIPQAYHNGVRIEGPRGGSYPLSRVQNQQPAKY